MTRESEHLELNRKKWDTRAETFDEKRFNYFRFMQKRVVALAHLRENQCFLDIGCGTGWAVRYAATLVKGGEAYGIDIAPKMIEKAKANADGLKNIHFLQADAEELPFNDNFFDVIICTNSFHHYLHPDKVVGDMKRVLKPGARLYIMDPTADSYLLKMIDWRLMSKDSDHVKLYSTREYKELFTGAGLKYISSKHIYPLVLFIKLHIAEKTLE